MFRDSLNVLRIAWLFAEKTSDGVDRFTEIVFLNNGVGPDRGKKFSFRNEFAAIADKVNEGLIILNEFVELTGFARSYAAVVLRNQGRVALYSF